MTRKSLKGYNCSVAQALEVIGDKWTILILRDSFLQTRSFSGFQSSLGIARNVLSERLSHLVENGILERRQTRPEVERYAYHLTQKGKSLLPLIIFLMQWGDKWIQGAGSEPLKVLDRKNGAPIQDIALQARDGRYVSEQDLTFTPGPGADEKTRELLRTLQSILENKRNAS